MFSTADKYTHDFLQPVKKWYILFCVVALDRRREVLTVSTGSCSFIHRNVSVAKILITVIVITLTYDYTKSIHHCSALFHMTSDIYFDHYVSSL